MRPLGLPALLASLALLGIGCTTTTTTTAASTGPKICCPGESRCGPESTVQRCAAPGGDRWTYELSRCKVLYPSTRRTDCDPGDTRCGADGRVERCDANGAGAGEGSTAWTRTTQLCEG